MDSRALDALVAEKVMGERVLWAHRAWSMEDWLCTDVPTEQNVMAIVVNDPGVSSPKYLVIPHYSTDIAAAWQVVERIVDSGKVFIIKGDGLRDGTYNPRYTVLCDNQPRTDAKTAPLAICLAALKVCGIEVE